MRFSGCALQRPYEGSPRYLEAGTLLWQIFYQPASIPVPPGSQLSNRSIRRPLLTFSVVTTTPPCSFQLDLRSIIKQEDFKHRHGSPIPELLRKRAFKGLSDRKLGGIGKPISPSPFLSLPVLLARCAKDLIHAAQRCRLAEKAPNQFLLLQPCGPG